MQASRGSRHTTLNLGVDGLVSRLVALLSIAVQVGRNRQFTHRVDDVGKRHVAIPRELYQMAGATLAKTGG